MKTNAAQYRTITRECIHVTREVATVTEDEWKKFVVMDPDERGRFLDSLAYEAQHTYQRDTEYAIPKYTAGDLNRLARRSAYREIVDKACHMGGFDELIVNGLSGSTLSGLRSCISALGSDVKIVQEKTGGDSYIAILRRMLHGTGAEIADLYRRAPGKRYELEFGDVLGTCRKRVVKMHAD